MGEKLDLSEEITTSSANIIEDNSNNSIIENGISQTNENCDTIPNNKNNDEDEVEGNTNTVNCGHESVPSNQQGILDSDDDSDINEKPTVNRSTLNRKSVARIDSDSDSENEVLITPHNKSFDDNVAEDSNNFNQVKSKLSALCDSDSEDERYNNESTQKDYNSDEVIEQTQQVKKKKAVKIKSQKPSNIEEDPKNMTPKQAAELRKEIQSESQRMLRERNISLPYHKPKSHSLKEFLARRPKLASAATIVGKAPPSVAIKMSTEQLEIISKQLKQREEEVKAFYKSESESEGDDPDDENYVPPNNEEIETSDKDAQKSSEAIDTLQDEIHMEIANTTEIPEPVAIPSDENDKNDLDAVVNAETPDTNIVVNSSTLLVETDLTEEPHTEEYQFSLDDESQSPVKNCLTTSINPITNNEPSVESSRENNPPTSSSAELDKEIEQFGENINENQAKIALPPLKTKLELLKEKLANVQPKLSGDPNRVIDLNMVIPKPTEVVQLMDRFVKHTAVKKKPPKHNVLVSIVTVDPGGDIHKETRSMEVSDEEDTAPEEKPGAKFKKLRVDLQNQMAQRKSEIWQQKAAKGIHNREDNEEIEYEQTDGKDILDDEDEEEIEPSDEDEYSDEEVVDDVDLKDKPRKKSEFLDEEAEVSEHDEDDETTSKTGYEDKVSDEDLEGDDEDVVSVTGDNDDTSQQDEDSNMSEKNATGNLEAGKKVLKRIIQLDDDSDDDDETDMFQAGVANQIQVLNEHLDSTVTADEDDMIPPHQPRQFVTPVRIATSQTKSISDFLTPISFLSSIQNLASNTKAKDQISPFRVPENVSPNKDILHQKELFTHSDLISSQSSLCSESQETLKPLLDSQSTSESQTLVDEEPPSTQDLMAICSGEFTGVTQLEPSSFSTTQSQEVKTLGTDQDMIISQLLDEEELENFKKKFESPVAAEYQHTQTEPQEITGGGILDSDDEDDENVDIFNKKKKTKKRRIQFSDDDSSEDEYEEEEIDLHEDVDNIGYDSEENEVEFNEAPKKEKMKLADFLDAEAELSESEWGSADEDEKGLDDLEFELGDTEKIDNDKVKEDLEKIHMRRMLDDDTREVKLLQELLLEDGELHGTGRQRQFKWRNIDTNDDQRNEDKEEETIFMDEEESEEQWRRRRLEREFVLKEKQRKNEEFEEDLLRDSQLLKMGQKILQRSQSNSQNNTPKDKIVDESESSEAKTPFQLFAKRGSFLSRGDAVLQRVAEYTKVSAEINVSSSKTTKNFVFQSVSSLEMSVAALESKKRKAAQGTPHALKKLRLSSNFSPIIKKKAKNSERSKKLFNF